MARGSSFVPSPLSLTVDMCRGKDMVRRETKGENDATRRNMEKISRIGTAGEGALIFIPCTQKCPNAIFTIVGLEEIAC